MKKNANLRNLHVGKWVEIKDVGGKKHICYLIWLDKSDAVKMYRISLKLANALIEAGISYEG